MKVTYRHTNIISADWRISFIYVADPEGKMIGLLKWE